MNADAKQRQQETQGKIQAAQTQYSPWTNIQPQGMNAQAIDQGGEMLGGAASGGLAGLMMKQKNDQQEKQNELLKTIYGQKTADSGMGINSGGGGYLGVDTGFKGG